MKSDYADLYALANGIEPYWYDENGVPRFHLFTPDLCPNIYADTVVLLEIACQYCHRQFNVEMNGGLLHPIINPMKLHYGDPPNHNCTGDTMNCDDLEVLEVWHKDRVFGGWQRMTDLEGKME